MFSDLAHLAVFSLQIPHSRPINHESDKYCDDTPNTRTHNHSLYSDALRCTQTQKQPQLVSQFALLVAAALTNTYRYTH